MKKILILFSLVAFMGIQITAQESSIIVLGDLHYDLLHDHDMEWLSSKPGDLRQVTQEYTVYTRENWNDFMSVLRERATSAQAPLKAVVQLGDLSEGLAGTEEKAMQMADHAMKAIDAVHMPAPWIIAKGNHDITGPGAIEAFKEIYVPMIRKQTGNPEIENASYTCKFDKVQITCVDPWDRDTDMIAFLEQELSGSDAKFKFVAIHEPVIPVTERCWHAMRNDPLQRERLLEIIARNKAIVLCGHLHRYSVVRRTTPYGPIVQIMVVSVVKDRKYQYPDQVYTEYGSSLAANHPGWSPESLDARKVLLDEEAGYVTYYKQTDLPGYALIRMDELNDGIHLEYYAAFGEEPYDRIDLTTLLKP